MTKRNAITFDELVDAKADVVTTLAVDEILMLQGDLDARMELLKRDRELFNRVMQERFASMAETSYREAGKDTGKVTVSIDKNYNLAVSRSKTVVWDQTQLAELWTKIGQADDSPETYMKREITYGVAEAVYKNWPEVIQKAFEPARSVKAGDLKISLEPKKEKK